MSRICLFGASASTWNLGVTALYQATVGQLLDREPDLEVTVFDFRWKAGERPLSWRGKTHQIPHLGANPSRRFWKSNTLQVMSLASRLRFLPNAGVERIRAADAVLDISGGDSFTDLYGTRRFEATSLTKEISLRAGRRLILLPQTYGPYREPGHRDRARKIVASATAAWARDPWSHARLEELLGEKFDPERHPLGVDVAFGLEARPPANPLAPRTEAWLASGAGPVVGLNVSGLIYSSAEEARTRYGFVDDYRVTLRGLVDTLLEQTDARIVLVPHVLAATGSSESDPEACRSLMDQLPAKHRDRVDMPTGTYDAGEVKHLIARLDWFCGTRMHATIAALSTGVPCAAIAYSPKFQGVFELCGQGEHVADPTKLKSQELVERLAASFRTREESRQVLANHLTTVRARLTEQFDRILASISAE